MNVILFSKFTFAVSTSFFSYRCGTAPDSPHMLIARHVTSPSLDF